MVQARVPQPVSLDEFLSWPEDSPALELINGVVEQKPVGNLDHAAAQDNLRDFLREHPATRDGRAFTDLGKSYRESPRGNHRVPDVSYFRSRDIPTDERRYPAVPPDLIAEVRSPGQSLASLEERIRFLLGQDVRVGLLIDPATKSVAVYREGAEPQRFTADDAEVVIPELGGFAFAPAALFD